MYGTFEFDLPMGIIATNEMADRLVGGTLIVDKLKSEVLDAFIRKNGTAILIRIHIPGCFDPWFAMRDAIQFETDLKMHITKHDMATFLRKQWT
jgi:hypothetical protein